MRFFNVFTLQQQDSLKIKLIEQGFSFKLLLFRSLWFLFNKMWFIGFLSLVVEVILINLFIQEKICGNLFLVCYLTFITLLTLIGQNLFESYLYAKKHKLEMVIVAQDQDEAQLKYFQIKDSKNYV